MSLTVTDSYYNMKEKLLPAYAFDRKRACGDGGKRSGGRIRPIRGGTDGAAAFLLRLAVPESLHGRPDFHGRYEYICIEDMRAVTNILCSLVQKYADFS